VAAKCLAVKSCLYFSNLLNASYERKVMIFMWRLAQPSSNEQGKILGMAAT
jgi:hypothetical protein